MAFVAVDKDETECIYPQLPIRMDNLYCWDDEPDDCHFAGIELPKGTIKKLIGYELTWDDEPVELK